MTRNDFLMHLRTGLSGHVAASEADRLCAYYNEMILDLMESGQSEAQAVDAMGSPNELVYAATKAAPVSSSHHHRWLLWSLVILGTPLWGSLALAAGAMGVAFELLLWSVPLVGGFVAAGFAIGGSMSVLMSVPAFFAAPFYGITQLGAGLACVGVGLIAGWLTITVIKYCALAHSWAFGKLAAQFSRSKEAWA